MMKNALISAIGTLMAPGVACFLVPYSILTAAGIPLARPVGILQILGILMVATGLFLVVWVSTTFVRRGRGTPVPIEPPKTLVVHGLYQYVRNPMYVGAVMIVLGEAVYFLSYHLALYAAGLWAILHTFMVTFEEPQLKRRFGMAYVRYLAEVPRWIPRFPIKRA